VHPSQDVLVGWSPDGKRTVRQRPQRLDGLWAVGFADGKVQGTPELLKPDIGRTNSWVWPPMGHCIGRGFRWGRRHPRCHFDFATGKFLSPPIAPIQTYVGTNQWPDWSPDGKYLAYASLRAWLRPDTS
jgi:Tol biopolymer transport system component